MQKVTDLKLAEYKRNVWSYRPVGVTVKDMLDPTFWAHVSNKLVPGDQVEAFAQDGSFYAEFIVLASKHAWVKVELLQLHEFGGKTKDDGEHLIKWSGGAKWRVIRKADGEVLQSGLQSKELAQEWLDKHKAE